MRISKPPTIGFKKAICFVMGMQVGKQIILKRPTIWLYKNKILLKLLNKILFTLLYKLFIFL